jgi:hypothetical protein
VVAELDPGQQPIYRDLLDLVQKYAAVLPDVRVAVRENANGRLVIAIVVQRNARRGWA